MREVKFEVPSWDYIYSLLTDLAEKIELSSFKPEVIIGVSRGGWVPARVLSDLLYNSNLANVRIEFYTGIYETKKKPVITQSVSLPVKGKRVLVVDDIVDTGESMRLLCDVLFEEVDIMKMAVLYYKPWSILKPDYYCVKTDSWVVFPWELCETVRKLGDKMFGEGVTVKDIETRLVEIGLNASIVQKILENTYGDRGK
jgi:hypoxanthine phosphoribosyltransferase